MEYVISFDKISPWSATHFCHVDSLGAAHQAAGAASYHASGLSLVMNQVVLLSLIIIGVSLENMD